MVKENLWFTNTFKMSSLLKKIGGGSKKPDRVDKSPAKSPTITKSSSKGDLENKSPDYGIWRAQVKHSPQNSVNHVNTINNVLPKEENSLSLSEEEQQLELSLPIRKKERNMSISKSGRHKFRNRQRSSVLGHDMYSPTTSPETSPTSLSIPDNRTLGLGAPLSLATGQPTSV